MKKHVNSTVIYPAMHLTKTISQEYILYILYILLYYIFLFCVAYIAGLGNQYLLKIMSLITSLLIIQSQSNFKISFVRYCVYSK